MKIRILGCGSSVGVPSIGCKCDVCTSNLQYNKRTRTSALIEYNNQKILIDASPDLRIQALNNNISSVEGVLFTHVHVDHCAGISELQAFTPSNAEKTIDIYSDFGTLCYLLSSRPHLFIPSSPNTPWNKCYYLKVHSIPYYTKFKIGDCEIVAINQVHGHINSNGFIFNDEIAYCTDVKSFPDESWELIKNKKVLVLGCLHYEPVKAHAHVDLCIEWVKELKPQICVLTHMSHYIDYYKLKQQLEKLTDVIIPGYDGLEINI